MNTRSAEPPDRPTSQVEYLVRYYVPADDAWYGKQPTGDPALAQREATVLDASTSVDGVIVYQREITYGPWVTKTHRTRRNAAPASERNHHVR